MPNRFIKHLFHIERLLSSLYALHWIPLYSQIYVLIPVFTVSVHVAAILSFPKFKTSECSFSPCPGAVHSGCEQLTCFYSDAVCNIFLLNKLSKIPIALSSLKRKKVWSREVTLPKVPQKLTETTQTRIMIGWSSDHWFFHYPSVSADFTFTTFLTSVSFISTTSSLDLALIALANNVLTGVSKLHSLQFGYTLLLLASCLWEVLTTLNTLFQIFKDHLLQNRV